MNLALQEAWKYQGLTYPNPAVGCCVVKNGEILAVDAHKKAGDPHAEVEALKEAYFKLTKDKTILAIESSHEIHTYLQQNHNGCFKEISLYSTLEPCSHVGKTPSCANLIVSLGIEKVFVGSSDFNEEASGGNKMLESNGCLVTNGVLEKECNALLEPFRLWQKEKFVFFKWAQRLNGSTDNGIISSKESRTHVHALRDKCDLLVIGGNTVRTDKPTLDARLVDGKAPDVLIISRSKEFDRTIPLFDVKAREVFIENNFNKLQDYKNIMIEGSAAMLNLAKEYIDYYLCYVAPKFGGNNTMANIETEFEILNIQKESQDIIMWMKEADE